MRRPGAFFLTLLVFLFFAEGQRAFFGSMFALSYDALFPAVDAGRALLALIPLLALLVPFVPLARWMERRGAVAVAVAGMAVFRLPMSHPALETRLVGGALVLAFFALFLTWAVGLLDRRALAAGAVAGLVADQLLRLAGTSYDLSLQPVWLPVQGALSLGLLVAAVAWSRGNDAPAAAEAGNELERRAGGLRLRGALALGPVLFLDLHVLGLSPVLSRWAGVSYEAAALLAAGAAAVALALALAGFGPTRGRRTLLGLVALIGLGVGAGWWGGGAVAAVGMAVGHGAALLLIARTLDPASGRRSGAAVSAGLALFVGLTAAYALTFFPAFTVPVLESATPWVFGAALILLAATAALLPQASGTPPALRPAGGIGAGLAVLVVAGLLVWWVVPRPHAGARALDTATTASASSDPPALQVATLNAHYGFDADWRFDPGRQARLLLEADPDVVALQEAPVGVPTAYGIDLPLWLARRTALLDRLARTSNGLMGEALLVRGSVAGLESRPLPARSGAAQLLRARIALGADSVSIHALHLDVDEATRREQAEALVSALDPGPAVVLGDLNADADGETVARLQAAGFQDVFAAAETAGAPTWPSDAPRRRIDWILVRGLAVRTARVHDEVASDHRLVSATLAPRTP